MGLLPSLPSALGALSSDLRLLHLAPGSVLTPVNKPWDFYNSLDEALVPGLIRVAGKMRIPTPLEPQQSAYGHGAANGAADSICASIGSWYRCPPTFHAFGWVYRRGLMQGEASEAPTDPCTPA